VRGAGFWCRDAHVAAANREWIVAEESSKAQGSTSATVIKKYANRRLYNTATSTYVTLDDLSQMVRAGTDFIVYDAKTGDDITRSVLTQIIFEEENKGGAQTLLPINFLRQLIRFYGDAMQGVVPGYLEMSLDGLTKEQGKIREQMIGPFGGEAFKGLEEITKRNVQMFQDAMKVFTPFAAGASSQPEPKPEVRPEPKSETKSSDGDLKAMKDQLAAMQSMIEAMAKKG
jgi:polyhydroxyalkanoate synthesis repressor PhaR